MWICIWNILDWKCYKYNKKEPRHCRLSPSSLILHGHDNVWQLTAWPDVKPCVFKMFPCLCRLGKMCYVLEMYLFHLSVYCCHHLQKCANVHVSPGDCHRECIDDITPWIKYETLLLVSNFHGGLPWTHDLHISKVLAHIYTISKKDLFTHSLLCIFCYAAQKSQLETECPFSCKVQIFITVLTAFPECKAKLFKSSL